LVQWNAYISKDGVKSAVNLDYFVILQGKISGSGHYRGKKFNLSGSWDLSTNNIFIERQEEGNETEFKYRGHVNDSLDLIRSKFTYRDGT